MKCKDCTNWGCLRRTSDAEKDCYYEEKEKISYQEMFDWESFRAEAAKDILCAMISHFGTKDIDMDYVVKWADSLIAKLKEKAEEYCKPLNEDENSYHRDITKIEVSL